MSLEHVGVSKKARDQLVTLKRRTGIENWNVLCRWALCVSLAERTPVRRERISADSTVEMTWKTFGGEDAGIYFALLRERCRKDGLDLTDKTVAEQFRLHLHRGIRYLAGHPQIKSISSLIQQAVSL